MSVHAVSRMCAALERGGDGADRKAPSPSMHASRLPESANELAIHSRVTGPKHGAIAIVRVLAAVERVHRPVGGSCEEVVVPFVAEQLVGAPTRPDPVRPAAPVEEVVLGATPKPVGPVVTVERVHPLLAEEEVEPTGPGHRVVAGPREDEVPLLGAGQRVVAPSPALKMDATGARRRGPDDFAVDGDVAGADERSVVTVTAVDDVGDAVVLARAEEVVSVPSLERVETPTCVEDVRSDAALQRVVPGAAPDEVSARIARRGVATALAEEEVRAAVARPGRRCPHGRWMKSRRSVPASVSSPEVPTMTFADAAGASASTASAAAATRRCVRFTGIPFQRWIVRMESNHRRVWNPWPFC